MKRVSILLLALVMGLGAAGLLTQQQSADAATGACGTSNASVSAPEQELFAMVNGWRASQFGASAMQLSGPAVSAAQWYAEEMIAGRAGSHSDALGRSWPQRLRDCGYDAFWSNASGEALAGLGSSNPSFGSSPAEALASMTAYTPNHSNGVQAPVAWRCGGVGYSSNSNPSVGGLRYAWVVVVAQYGSSTCPQAVTGGGTAPTATTPATSTPTKTPTPSPTPSPTPTPRSDGAAVTIVSGWNLVVVPSGQIDQVLYRAKGCFRSVYQQDGDRWLRYSPDAPAYASNLKTSNGGVFWVEGTAANCGLVPL